MPGLLYLIAGPIGNLEDITLRAQKMLRQLTCFFVEDTREIKKLFGGLGIDASGKEFFSYASHNLKAATQRAIEKLEEGISVGFLSDRGTPGISDPGSWLVHEAYLRNITVIPIPGPSAVVTALSVSGMVTNRFVFLGFLPRKETEQEALWQRIEKTGFVFCFFESPERAKNTCEAIQKRFPAGVMLIGRELTKVYESLLRFELSKEIPAFPTKGEFVIVVDPRVETTVPVDVGAEALSQKVAERLASEREWAKIVSKELGVPVSDVYNSLQKAK